MGGKLELGTKLLIVHCVLSVIFIAVFIISGMYTSNDNTCSTNEYKYYSGIGVNDLTGFELTTEDSYFLQDFDVRKEHMAYRFCFSSLQSSSNALRVQIINEDLTELAALFLDNKTDEYCIELLNSSNIYSTNYIGVLCENCNDSQNMTFRYPTIGEDKEVIYFNNDDTSPNAIYISLTSTVKSLIFDIEGLNDCKYLTKFFLWSYVNISILFLFIFILLIGFNFMQDSTVEMFQK